MPKQSERRVLCDVAGGDAGSDTNKVGEGSDGVGAGWGQGAMTLLLVPWSQSLAPSGPTSTT